MGKKLVSLAVNVLCVAAILFSLLAAWVIVTTPTGKAPNILGYSMLTVLTGSMEPTIPEGSLIITRQTNAEEIRSDDVITFYTSIQGYDGVINTHRVVEVTDEEGSLAFRTKGDANPIDDTRLVAAELLVGKVVFHSYLLGMLISFLREPYVFLPLVLIPLFILILRSAFRLIRIAREEFRQAEEEVKREYHDKDDS